MNKLYNTQSSITSGLSNFFQNISNISKPHLKIIPPIIFGMISSESVVTSDIVKKLKGDFSLVSPASTTRRLERFFNNPSFQPYSFFDNIISHIISNYKPSNPNIYISFDHTFCKDKFTIILFSLRIGKQRYPFMV